MFMMNYFESRRIKKKAHILFTQSRHFRNYNYDIIDASVIKKVIETENNISDLIKESKLKEAEAKCGALEDLLNKNSTCEFPRARENIEVFVVALALAMAFKSYFFQPFKIPTGSMQPTLWGIRPTENYKSTVMDKVPFRYIKWIWTGTLYKEIRVKYTGILNRGISDDPANMVYEVGNQRYSLPRNIFPQYSIGDIVPAGSNLWSGAEMAGDHVFVNKMIWHFKKPALGDVIVFKTDGIKDLPGEQHYIKRLCGLPGNIVAIEPPNLIINGKKVEKPEAIARIERKDVRKDGRYSGYVNPYPPDWKILTRPGETYKLKDGEYLALGDNTDSSKDSRYWGPVPEKNIVGPAVFIYWPFYRQSVIRGSE